jgi:hypothetical protein
MVLREIREQRVTSVLLKQPSSYPLPDEIAMNASKEIVHVMTRGGKSKTGSTKSGPGEWFTRDSIRYSADRAVSHMATAMMMLDGNKKEDKEGVVGHLQRALCRAAMVLYKIRKGQKK